MADIFGKDDKYSNSNVTTADQVTLKAGKITTNSLEKDEYLVQNIAIQYSQPIQVLNEIGSNKRYLLQSKAQGTCRIGRIVGAKTIEAIFGKFGGDIWTAEADDDKGRTITVATGTKKGNTGKGFSYVMTGCIVESYSLAVDTNGNMCQEDVNIRFCGLAG